MKRIILILSAALSLHSITGQTEFDALRYIQPDISGTARYTSMAGAFGALGADPSAIKDNPAGLGIYRSPEISATFNSLTQNASSNWMGNSASDGLYKLGINNFTFILSSPTSGSGNSGLLRSNWAFSYNRIKDYNRNIKINGGSNSKSSVTDYMGYFTGNTYGESLYETNNFDPYKNTSVSWLSVIAANAGLMKEYIDSETNETLYWTSFLNDGETVSPSYYQYERGYMNDYAFSWSGNFQNRLFLGATVNIYDINYRSDAEYSESFEKGGNMSLKNVMKVTGTGVGLKLGTIYAPLDYLRFGFAVQTPVVYRINDVHYADLNYYYTASSNGVIYTPEGTDEYKVQSPLVFNLSSSFIFGKKGVIGVEYVNSQNPETKLMNIENNTNGLGIANDSIRSLFKDQHTIKIGGEYRLNDNFSLRAGYAFTGAATSSDLGKEMNPNTTRTDVEYFIQNSTSYLTAGVGYRESKWYVDLAIMNKMVNEKFSPYNSRKLGSNLQVNPASINNFNFNVVATIGFKL
ncbi:MAG: outer membrane protein transport protein [Paludibacter sp.]|nr:outer membrane protein transport protein [Paludibacter sp.]